MLSELEKKNLFIISLLAEAQRAVGMLTRVSGKAEEDVDVGGGDGTRWSKGTEFINLLPSENQINTFRFLSGSL